MSVSRPSLQITPASHASSPARHTASSVVGGSAASGSLSSSLQTTRSSVTWRPPHVRPGIQQTPWCEAGDAVVVMAPPSGGRWSRFRSLVGRGGQSVRTVAVGTPSPGLVWPVDVFPRPRRRSGHTGRPAAARLSYWGGHGDPEPFSGEIRWSRSSASSPRSISTQFTSPFIPAGLLGVVVGDR